MKILNIIYATTYAEKVQILRDLIKCGYKRHHSAHTPATHNLKYYGAVACFAPYHGRFSTGYTLVQRSRSRRNYQISYYVKSN